jgi:hypothetical protein
MKTMMTDLRAKLDTLLPAVTGGVGAMWEGFTGVMQGVVSGLKEVEKKDAERWWVVGALGLNSPTIAAILLLWGWQEGHSQRNWRSMVSGVVGGALVSPPTAFWFCVLQFLRVMYLIGVRLQGCWRRWWGLEETHGSTTGAALGAAAVPPPRQTWLEYFSSFGQVLFPIWGGVGAAVEPAVAGADEATAAQPDPISWTERVGGLYQWFTGGTATAAARSGHDPEVGEGRVASMLPDPRSRLNSSRVEPAVEFEEVVVEVRDRRSRSRRLQDNDSSSMFEID